MIREPDAGADDARIGAPPADARPDSAGDADDAPPPPPPRCGPPASTPPSTSQISLFRDANAYAGPDNTACAFVGMSRITTNPQTISCRRLGTEVKDGDDVNHWWLWTELDQGGDANGFGWISAYYIQGQGNDEANDDLTGRPIPDCP